MTQKNEFNADDIHAFLPAEKVGIIATIDPEGLPHITLITSLRAAGPRSMVFGQFCDGLSKVYVQNGQTVAFIIMTLDKSIWQGHARWTHLRKEGPEFEELNALPMFRYNTYFGINTVHYLDLIETTEKKGLPVAAITAAALKTKLAKGGAQAGKKESILKQLGLNIFNGLDSLKFLSYIDGAGLPVLVPLIQCQAADSTRLVFSPSAYSDEIGKIPEGSMVAVFGLTMQMEDILIRGRYNGIKRFRGIKLGSVDIERVYNSMPPSNREIYPETDLKAVVNF